MDEILLVFKTHLDLGFTDSAENVISKYCDEYIPKAIDIANALKDTDTPFIWTTGSFMIKESLKRADVSEKKRMEDAIRNGFISWHGLPFTTHTELMSKELFLHGVSLAKQLDSLYGRKTIAAKMTDVPGHTIQMVPHLAEQGIRFLHIGVNEACHPPEVPEIFRWKSPDGAEIVVMYQSGYGRFASFANGKKAVCFAHTNDNLGPQSIDEVQQIYALLQKQYPEAIIRAGDLNDLASAVLNDIEQLPIITSEIGDTWIHGTGTDPAKVFWFREMLRMAKDCPVDERERIYDELLMIPEHTWGLDEKTFMPDHTSFRKEELIQLRQTAGAVRMEESWQEQRNFIRKAIAALPADKQEQACERLNAYRRDPVHTDNWEKLNAENGMITIRDWKIQLQENGAICYLQKGDTTYADRSHLVGLAHYELFSEEDYDRYMSAYLIARPNWAIEDNKKIGMAKAIQEHQNVRPTLRGLYRKENMLLIQLEFSKEIAQAYGCPAEMEYIARFTEERVQFDLAWWNKQACRCAEALWFSFEPLDHLQAVSKLGGRVAVNDVCSWGNRRLHAGDGKVFFDHLALEMADSCLLSAGGAALLDGTNRLPSQTAHPDRVDLNLYNNIWGTNFPMWYEEDARFRFELQLVR